MVDVDVTCGGDIKPLLQTDERNDRDRRIATGVADDVEQPFFKREFFACGRSVSTRQDGNQVLQFTFQRLFLMHSIPSSVNCRETATNHAHTNA